MTGGTEEAGRINRELASIAEERGYGFGLGSQRAMHVRPGTRDTYRVRDVAPTTLVLGNVGVVQARAMTTSEVRVLVDEVGADALCVHLNPAMELVQPGGDRDFAQGLDTIARLGARPRRAASSSRRRAAASRRPSARACARSASQHVDVSGAGGTSWVGVETRRAAAAGDAAAEALGEALLGLGRPHGGVASRCSRRWASRRSSRRAGIATGSTWRAPSPSAQRPPASRGPSCAPYVGGRARRRPMSQLDAVETELRAAMLLTGSRDSPLSAAPRACSWLRSRPGSPSSRIRGLG